MWVKIFLIKHSIKQVPQIHTPLKRHPSWLVEISNIRSLLVHQVEASCVFAVGVHLYYYYLGPSGVWRNINQEIPNWKYVTIGQSVVTNVSVARFHPWPPADLPAYSLRLQPIQPTVGTSIFGIRTEPSDTAVCSQIPLSLITQNLDAFSRPVTRVKLLLDGIFKESQRPDIIFLQEVTSDVRISILGNPEVREAFLVTDVEDQTLSREYPLRTWRCCLASALPST